MKRSNKTFLGIVVMLILIVLFCYSVWEPPKPVITVNFPTVTMAVTNASTTSELFDTYTEQLFLEEIKENTLNMHYTLAYPENFGITEYSPSLGSFTLEEMQQSYADLKEIKEKLAGFSYDELTKEQQFTYDMILDYISTELMAEDMVLYTEVLGPVTGYQVQLPVLLAEYTFREEQDITDYFALIVQTDELFEQILEFERKKSEAGLFMPDYVADAIIGQCNNFIENPEENYLIETFETKINAVEGLSEEQKQAYITQNENVVNTEVIWAYQKLAEGLNGLKGTATNDKGLSGLEDGKRYYEYLVRSFTGSSRSVEELMNATEETIGTCLSTMTRIMTNNPNVVNDWDTYQFCETEPENILNDLVKKIAADFPQLPEAVSYEVKDIPPSLEENMSPAFYLTPPVDDVNHNVIYVNSSLADHNLYATLAHEGYPGHLFQNAYSAGSQHPLIRKMLAFPGYSEGWATYAECYAYGIGGLEAELAEVLVLNSIATLGIHAYVDMAVHYLGWSCEDVEQYLAIYDIDGEVAKKLFESVVAEPANYLSYFVGYLEITNLQNAAKESWGDNFNLKKFHQAVLSLGPAPFALLEKAIKVYE